MTDRSGWLWPPKVAGILPDSYTAANRLFERCVRYSEVAMTEEFDVVVEKDSEGFFVATVPVLPGCHTQARSLDELMVRVKEAIELCLEVQGARPPRHVTTRHDQAAAGGLRYRTAGF